MSFHLVLAKLKESKEFKKFKEENQDSYLSSAFFIFDYEGNTKTQQLDYFLPDQNKICLFTINNKITSKVDDILQKENKEIERLNDHINVETGTIETLAKKEAEKEKKALKKIFAVLQKQEGNQVWNLTCILEGMGMLKLKIDCQSGELIDRKMSNLMDFVKKD